MPILKFSNKVRVATIATGKGDIYQRVSRSRVFVVHGSMGYYQDLMKRDRVLLFTILAAKELKKPVILLMDKTLSERQKINFERIFAGMNIIKEEIFDFNDPAARAKTTVEIESITLAMQKEELNEFMTGIFRWQ